MKSRCFFDGKRRLLQGFDRALTQAEAVEVCWAALYCEVDCCDRLEWHVVTTCHGITSVILMSHARRVFLIILAYSSECFDRGSFREALIQFH